MNRLRARRALSAVLCLALLALAPLPAGAQTEDDVARAEAAADAAYRELVEVNAQLEEAVTDYLFVNSELEDITWRISQLIDRVQDYESEVRDLRERARTLVIEAYMSGGGGSVLSLVFEAESIQQLVTGQVVIDRATDRDLASLERLEVVRREMDRLKVDLEVDQERVAELRVQAEEVVDRLDALQAQASALYARADSDARTARAKFEAEERRKRLAALAAKQGASGGVSDSVTPGFTCPAPGSTFINDWGYPRSGGRTHKGTDMFAPRGSNVVAVADGTVRFRSNSLGGTVAFVYADHGVYYYYAHLDGYAAGITSGQRVSRGQTIGYVGNTGNAIGTRPHLHFEIHPGGGAAVNPYPTLARHC
jgi:murein DD-endopeptidase MepM/ murein hydrolase activator NlpD